MPSLEIETVTAPDGRVLEVRTAGAADGTVLLFHHGTPGGGATSASFLDACAARGLRYVAAARPGYAGSTRLPGRSVADVAIDAAVVLDHIGVERCLTIGWSGGGPHALACAAGIPERILAASTIGSVAPYDADGLDYLAGMGAENVEEFQAVLDGPAAHQASLEAMLPGWAAVTADDCIAAFGDLVDDVDRGALTGDFAASVAADIRLGLSSGLWGWYDDDRAFVEPWGVDLADITVPVDLWHGAHDRMVPFAHGEWLAGRMPAARAHLLPEHGHLSLVVGSIGTILDALLEAAGTPA